jgi:hypothetical protein
MRNGDEFLKYYGNLSCGVDSDEQQIQRLTDYYAKKKDYSSKQKNLTLKKYF